MKRGDIYWVNLEPTQGSEIKKLRPCVIVSATPINQVRRTLVVVPLSSSAQARPPITVAITCLNRKVVAVCDQIRTVDKSRLAKVAGALSLEDLQVLENGLRAVLVLAF